MLLEKFSRIIEGSAVGRALERKGHILDVADPRRIYVENIRSFFNVPTGLARAICDLGVKTGQFTKHIGYVCPGCHTIIAESNYDEPLDDTEEVYCRICDLYDNREGPSLIRDCEKSIFYSIPDSE